MEVRQIIVRRQGALPDLDEQAQIEIEVAIYEELYRTERSIRRDYLDNAYLHLCRAFVMCGALVPEIYWEPRAIQLFPGLLVRINYRLE